jgi:asparagine synthase (glutamine-hydrolysing)
MAAATDQPVHTFTIGFHKRYRRGEITLDDTSVARRTAEQFGCRHTKIIAEPDVAELLPKLVWHMDEPTADPALIMAYLVNREAHRDVTVLLSGVGGDELFAGYRKYVAHYLAARYQRIPGVLRDRLIGPAVGRLPSLRGTPLKGYVRLAKKMVRSGSLPYRDRFITDSVYLSEDQKERLLTPAARQQRGHTDPWVRHKQFFEEAATADELNQLLYVDSKTFMPSLNLNYNDKMSMASSVEVRVPFLDWELAEWVAWNIPPSMKLDGWNTKSVFREAMRPVLPKEVLEQRKAGFGAPTDYWLANDLRPMVDDLLSDAALRKRGLFEPREVRRLVEEQRSGRQDWSMQIWQLLTLELWFRAFID